MRARIGALLAIGLLCGLAETSTSLAADTASASATPAIYRRPPDQTFLTFPEWYLVHSPAEYAAFLAHAEKPSTFPLFSHIGQFWRSYAAVSREASAYPFNPGYHLMILVIGSSTTVEYGLKGLYEHTVGRLAESTKSQGQVPEERFGAQLAQEYVDFIRIDPWYRFDFASRLVDLWTKVPLSGPDAIRRWERRFALTSELLVKEGYARLIKLGTQSIYDPPKPATAVVLNRAPRSGLVEHPDFHLLDAPRHNGMLATVPRYEAFTTYSLWLASQGIDFAEVAGNDGEMVISLLAPDGWSTQGARLLFAQPILTQPGRKRFVLTLPVARLGSQLRAVASQPGVSVEHVYDY